jgi:hypothetical protein
MSKEYGGKKIIEKVYRPKNGKGYIKTQTYSRVKEEKNRPRFEKPKKQIRTGRNQGSKGKPTEKKEKKKQYWKATKYTARGPVLADNKQAWILGSRYNSNANSVLPVTVPLSYETLVGPAVATVSLAYSHGYRQRCAQNSSTQDYPYYAMLYFFHLLEASATMTQVTVPKNKIAVWIRDLLAEISPKTGALLGSGVLSYKWDYSNNTVPGPTFNYPLSSTTSMYFGQPGGTTTGGYNTMIAASGGYTTEIGGVAFAHLCTFLSNLTVIQRGEFAPWQLVDLNVESSPLNNSVAAFAASNKVIGKGLIGGYLSSIASSETHIDAPKFSVFARDDDLSRGFRAHHPSSGDSNWLVASILNQKTYKEYFSKNYTIFKPCDAFEFFDRVASYIARAFGHYYASQNSNNTSRLLNIGLTASEFLVLMRLQLMKIFSATQYGVQTIYPYVGTVDNFIPWPVTACGAPAIDATPVLLPLFLTENLQALRAREIYTNINPATGKLDKKSPRMYVGILGQYAETAFEAKTYQYNNGSSMVSIFTGDGDSVDLINCKCNTVFVDFGGSPKIFEDTEQFNSVMTVLGPYTQQQTMLEGDEGIAGISVIGRTYVVGVTKQEDKKCKKERRKSVNDPSIALEEKRIRAYLSQQVPVSGVTAIQKSFWNPEFLEIINQQATGNVTIDTLRSLNLEMWQEMFGQNFSSGGNENLPMVEMRKACVDNCAKAYNADNSTVVKSMLRLAETGRAGILGDLAKQFAAPLLMAGTSALTSMIPF